MHRRTAPAFYLVPSPADDGWVWRRHKVTRVVNTLHGLRGRERPLRCGLVVLVFSIDRPQCRLVRSATDDGVDGGLSSQHRVVLVVVPMHAVAPHGKQV